jgi:hypothetical protein
MKRLVLESWLLLLYVDWIMRFREFTELHRMVRVAPVHPIVPGERVPNEKLCRVVDYACVFYFKRVLCLQRSAATTLFLRRHGWNAEMVIGAQMLPFKSHAWCEINSAVVNDKPYILDVYSVLERC